MLCALRSPMTQRRRLERSFVAAIYNRLCLIVAFKVTGDWKVCGGGKTAPTLVHEIGEKGGVQLEAAIIN